MSKQLQLGVLELVLPKSNLQASLLATATFANSSYSPDSFAPPPIEHLNWDTVRQSWVRRGIGLSLKLGIQVNGVPLAESHMKNLETVICRAEVRMQCQLYIHNVAK